jgi:hypothetical protein
MCRSINFSIVFKRKDLRLIDLYDFGCALLGPSIWYIDHLNISPRSFSPSVGAAEDKLDSGSIIFTPNEFNEFYSSDVVGGLPNTNTNNNKACLMFIH